MSTDRDRPDPARILALLWRSADVSPLGDPPAGPPRGPRPTLTVDLVVDAAITLADTGGIEALTIRHVAQALNVSPMSVYTYVPGKAELLDLMLDTVYRRMYPSEEGAAPERDWRARVSAVAHANRALYTRHPWVADLPNSRPPLGPGTMAKYEVELRALDGLGLTDVDMDAALTHVLGFVEACARAAARARAAQEQTAMSDAAWWAANAPLLERIFDPTRYPLAARVGAAAGEAHQAAYDPDHAYTFGLSRVLDGLAALVERR